MSDRGHTDPAAQYVDRLAGYDLRLQQLERSHTHEPQTPVGAIVAWAGGNAPALWLLCDGSALSTVAYPDLFAALGYYWGGAGTSFNLPNLSSRLAVAAGPAGPGLSARPLGATGGAETVALSAAATGSHTHGWGATSGGESLGHNHGFAAATAGVSVGHTHGGSTGNDTPVHAHQNAAGTGTVATGGNSGSAPFAGYNGDTGNPTVSHTHPFTTGGQSADHGHNVSGTTAGDSADHSHNVSGTTDTGPTAGAAHENMPPFVALYMIIKALPSTAAGHAALTVIERT